jgi:DNA-binding MarR family transcriptional regulator
VRGTVFGGLFAKGDSLLFLRTLHLANGKAGTTQAAIRKELCLTQPVASGFAAKLKKMEWITSEVSISDRRENAVRTTKKGKELLAKLDAELVAILRQHATTPGAEPQQPGTDQTTEDESSPSSSHTPQGSVDSCSASVSGIMICSYGSAPARSPPISPAELLNFRTSPHVFSSRVRGYWKRVLRQLIDWALERRYD